MTDLQPNTPCLTLKYQFGEPGSEVISVHVRRFFVPFDMPRTVKIAKSYDIEPGEGTTVFAEGQRIAVFNSGGEFHAISDTCVHAGASLGTGWLQDDYVACPLHGWRFNIKTGVSDIHKNICVDRFEVHQSGTDLFLSLDD